ncbi:MAG: sulfite exporter TauE/SafE family protein, partial [Caldilineaceae bacterium]|nr:sulfite exporter TauE/SafE family protein [Caldilineaceae bacterium]
LLVGFGIYSLVRPTMTRQVSRWWAYLCGFLAGCLGGAYNVHGPPIVVYGSLRHWPPPQFRASLQSFFLPSSILILIGHGLGGLWSPEAFWLFGLALAPIILAVFLGSWLNRLIPPGRFDRLIHAIILTLGLLLLLSAR